MRLAVLVLALTACAPVDPPGLPQPPPDARDEPASPDVDDPPGDAAPDITLDAAVDLPTPEVPRLDVLRVDVAAQDRADARADLPPPDRAEADVAPLGPCVALDPWRRSTDFASGDVVSHPLPSFAVGAWYFVHTMRRDGSGRRLMAARALSDGALGAWQVATDDHGGGPHGFFALTIGASAYMFRNGHIGRYPLTADGRMTGDVVLLEESADRAFDGNRYVWDSAAVAGGAVIHLGGFSFTGYMYRPAVMRAAAPPAGRFTRTGLSHPAARPGHAAVVSAAGGEARLFTADALNARLWSLPVRVDGSLGAWREHTPVPPGDGNLRGDLVALGDSLLWVRGSRVHVARVDASGSPGAWRAMPSLPEAQVDMHWGEGHHEGAAWGTVGDVVYVTGPRAVYGARLRRGVACAP